MPDRLIEDLKSLLLHGVNTTQETLCMALEAKGHQVYQTKISRLLKKINAIKSKNSTGEMVYRLPHDVTPPAINTELSGLIIDILCNETMIVIKTSPGSASLIARIMDNKQCQLIGTIAGDDTIFAVPESTKKIREIFGLICSFFEFSNSQLSSQE